MSRLRQQARLHFILDLQENVCALYSHCPMLHTSFDFHCSCFASSSPVCVQEQAISSHKHKRAAIRDLKIRRNDKYIKFHICPTIFCLVHKWTSKHMFHQINWTFVYFIPGYDCTKDEKTPKRSTAFSSRLLVLFRCLEVPNQVYTYWLYLMERIFSEVRLCIQLGGTQRWSNPLFVCFLLNGGLRPPDPHPGSRVPCITHIPDTMWTTIHILPISQTLYGPYGPYRSTYQRVWIGRSTQHDIPTYMNRMVHI